MGDNCPVAKGVKTKLAERLDPLLPGFHRARWVWNRFDGKALHAIELQGSKHGTGDLSISWGIAPIGWRGLSPKSVGSAVITTPQCAIHGSVGDFHGTSGWWDHQDVERGVPDDLLHLIQDHLLYFFQDMSSVESMLAVAKRGYRAYPRNRSALDENGWPTVWTWPRMPDHQKLVQGVLLVLYGQTEEGRAHLQEVPRSDFVRSILHDCGLN